MAEIDITRISSKGQVVIPLEMRKHLKEGDKLLIIKSGEQLILKKATEMDKNMNEDLEFAKRTEEAWKRYSEGKFKCLSADDFLLELEKC